MKNTKVIWKGEEKLRSLLVPLESLTCDDANAVKHSPRNIAAIKASLSRRGQYQLVAVQKKGRIVRVGNGRVIAMRELGWTHVAALVINESSADAISRALVDNKSGHLAKWDNDTLTALVRSLGDDANAQLEEAWTEEDINSLMDAGREAPDQSSEIKERYDIIVECHEEEKQSECLKLLTRKGYKCRAIVL